MKAADMNLRSMPDATAMAGMAKDVKDTKMLDVVAHEVQDTVNGDNPSKEYVTGSGKPSGPLGAKGRN